MKKDKNGQPARLTGHYADEWMEQLWENLAEKLTAIESKAELKKILEHLFSHYEKKMMLKRLAIIALARSGRSYREIGRALWVSPQTISTIKKSSLKEFGHYKSYRSLYSGPRPLSSFTWKPSPSLLDKFQEILDSVEIFLKPFFRKGIGVMGDRAPLFRSTKKKNK